MGEVGDTAVKVGENHGVINTVVETEFNENEYEHEFRLKRRRLFMICAIGVFICHFILGLLQENMYVSWKFLLLGVAF